MEVFTIVLALFTIFIAIFFTKEDCEFRVEQKRLKRVRRDEEAARRREEDRNDVFFW